MAVSKPVLGGGVEIVFGSKVRMPTTVTDHHRRNLQPLAPLEEIEDAGERPSVSHPRTVDLALQLCPGVFEADSAQMIADGILGHWTPCRHQPTPNGNGVKKGVVAHDRIVEIQTQEHSFASQAI
jgi:hypothetical protein